MGSNAYGVSSDNSDCDIYGYTIPLKEDVFPHLKNEILGFGKQTQRFEVWQQHHVKDPSANSGHGREYDFSIYSIVKFFHIAMDCNPNIIDSLFTPLNCVLQITLVGNLVRENRRLFLHKGAFHRFKGYAYAQLAKMDSNKAVGKRAESIEKFGFDCKYVYHVFRLLDECRQILMDQDLDLQRNREELRSIRRGEWTLDDIRKVCAERERGLEKLFEKSKLQNKPNESKIKQLLLDCLEIHYGSIEDCVVQTGVAEQALRDIKVVLDKVIK